jgi:hypothetical protein
MMLVPLFDLKFLTSSPRPVQEFQIGGTSVSRHLLPSCGKKQVTRFLPWHVMIPIVGL